MYRENIQFPGKDIVLTSTYVTNPAAVSRTILDGGGRGPVVTFAGSEGSSCIFAGFTIQNGQGDEAGGVFGQGTGTTMSHLIVRSNRAGLWGGGLSGCNGRIQNMLITGNSASEGSALFRCDGEIRNCTIAGNAAEWYGPVYQCHATIRNSIIWGNPTTQGSSIWPAVPTYSCIEDWTEGGTGNLSQDPRFVNVAGGDYRLQPSSPCLDVGDNTLLNLPPTDLAGGHRLIYGGKGFTIDMGAFEHCINACALEPTANTATLTWSSLAGRVYSILWSQDLHDWLPAVQVLPSAGDTTTSWTDDGSQTGDPPGLAPHRFYRVRELP